MRLKERANSLDVPYQSLMKEYIARRFEGRVMPLKKDEIIAARK